MKKCVSMKWSTEQPAASMHVSVHAAPRLKPLCSTHWQSMWITNQARKQVLEMTLHYTKCCQQNVLSLVLTFSHGSLGQRTLAAYLPVATEASKPSLFQVYISALMLASTNVTYPFWGDNIKPPTFYLHCLFTWSLVVHWEAFVNGGPSSNHCHLCPRLLFRWTILPATGPGRDEKDAAESEGATLTG